MLPIENTTAMIDKCTSPHLLAPWLFTNKEGTHVYDNTKKCFLTIYELDYAKTTPLDCATLYKHTVEAGPTGQSVYLSRFVLECKLKRVLLQDHVADHENCDRRDNSFENLRDLHVLANANNKVYDPNKSNCDIVGVWWDEERRRYRAHVRMYTPDDDDATRSKTVYRVFAYGPKSEDDEETAKRKASEWRALHYLIRERQKKDNNDVV